MLLLKPRHLRKDPVRRPSNVVRDTRTREEPRLGQPRSREIQLPPLPQHGIGVQRRPGELLGEGPGRDVGAVSLSEAEGTVGAHVGELAAGNFDVLFSES